MDKSCIFLAMFKRYCDLFAYTQVSMQKYHQNPSKASSARHLAKAGDIHVKCFENTTMERAS